MTQFRLVTVKVKDGEFDPKVCSFDADQGPFAVKFENRRGGSVTINLGPRGFWANNDGSISIGEGGSQEVPIVASSGNGVYAAPDVAASPGADEGNIKGDIKINPSK